MRDPIRKREKTNRGKGCPTTYEDVETDPGEPDKRAVVYEPEFAGVLKQTERQGNTASVVLRQLWDGREVVQTLTKNNPAKATGAHVSMIGHITPEELHRYLTATESANGFANRFVLACVRRSKMLPDGGTPDPATLMPLRRELAVAVAFARTAGEVQWHPSSRPLWHAVYPLLTGERAGLSGALSARAAPHVRRFALLFALLDGSTDIRPVHLMAGIALWDYCERSVLFLFGDRTGNQLADELRDLLPAAPVGLTRTELVSALGRHQFGDKLTAALVALEMAGLARREKVDTGGKPAERWYATSRPAAVSPLMAAARRAFADCGACDESDQSDQSPPRADPSPPFGRIDRFHRTPVTEPPPPTRTGEVVSGSVSEPWRDTQTFFALMKSRGWTWPMVLEWLKAPPTFGFIDIPLDEQRRAWRRLERLPLAPERGNG